jgi:integrase
MLTALFNAAIKVLKLPMPNPWHVDDPKNRFIPTRKPRLRFLSYEEQDRLMPQLRVRRGTDRKLHICYEDERWVTLIIGTGLRHEEFLAMCPAHLTDDGFIYVPEGKGDKERWVPYGEDVAEALEAQRIARGLALDDTRPYWAETYAAPLRYLHAACKRAKILVPLTIHDLRRTYGTRAANDFDVDIEDLQVYMGHVSIETTRKYYIVKQRERLKRGAAGIRVTVPMTDRPQTRNTKVVTHSENEPKHSGKVG